MVLCVGLNSTDTPCSPGPGSTLKVPLGNRTAMLRPEAENMRADLADGPPGSESGSPYLCRHAAIRKLAAGTQLCMQSAAEHSKSNDSKARSYVLSAALLASWMAA